MIAASHITYYELGEEIEKEKFILSILTVTF